MSEKVLANPEDIQYQLGMKQKQLYLEAANRQELKVISETYERKIARTTEELSLAKKELQELKEIVKIALQMGSVEVLKNNRGRL